MSDQNRLRERATALHLHGLLAHWDKVASAPWLSSLIDWEEQERTQRSLARRTREAQIGPFKPLCDFDWNWPTVCDRAAVEAMMTLGFLKDATNGVVVGPNGIGKTMIVQNILHQALLAGHTALFTTAGRLLGDLASVDSDAALQRRLNHYVRPAVIAIDEVGYLSYSNRHADLLFELLSRRYRTKSTLVTTNLSFSDWKTVFPNATCVVTLVDRLTHYAEIINIDGESYRIKEARERNEQRSRQRRSRKP